MRLSQGVTGRHVVVVAGLLAILSWALWQWARRGGALVPSPGLLPIVLLLVIAGLVVSVAWPVRNRQRGAAAPSFSSLRAARALVIAQAAALTGAGATGWYAGQFMADLGDLSLRVARVTAGWLGGAIAASILLTAAGLWAQHVCRIDDSDNPPPAHSPGPAGSAPA